MENQQLMNEKGESVEFLKNIETVDYLVMETDTHSFRRQKDKVDNLTHEVLELKEAKKFKQADRKAEAYIRGCTRSKANTEKLSRKDYLTAAERSLRIFKEQLFGYNALKKEEIEQDQSDE